jgi:predicted Na+-dependent transporter
MDALVKLIPVLIQASLFLIVFGVGLQATMADARFLFRRPGLLVRSLLAMYVIVPLFAVVLAVAFHLHPVVKLALILMAISPLPPVIPKKELKLGGEESYVVGLLVAVSLLCILTVPITLALVSAASPYEVHIAPAALARVLSMSILLPLALGMGVRGLAHSFADRAAPLATRLGSLLLVVAALPILIKMWPAMARLIGSGTVLAFLAVVGVALLAGHWLGGPDPDDRMVLATASASRHPAIAILIGSTNFPAYKPQVAAAVLLYVLVGTIAAAPYVAWRKRHLAETAGGAEPGPTARRPA